MVKLVDTLVSGTSGRKAVQVRVLFWAPKHSERKVWERDKDFSFVLTDITHWLHIHHSHSLLIVAQEVGAFDIDPVDQY